MSKLIGCGYESVFTATKSFTMVKHKWDRPGSKKVACLLQVSESPHQVKEFYLGVLFTSGDQKEHWNDRRSTVPEVMWLLYWTVMEEQELSRKATINLPCVLLSPAVSPMRRLQGTRGTCWRDYVCLWLGNASGFSQRI